MKSACLKLASLAWAVTGSPWVWVVMMVVITGYESIHGFTLIGAYWFAVCLFSSLLAGMRQALDRIADRVDP